MDKIAITKKVVRLVVSTGAAKIVHQIIKTNASPNNSLDQVTMFAGSLALGGLVAHHSAKYADKMIDDIVKAWNEFKNSDPE